jgi:hypothetical protein
MSVREEEETEMYFLLGLNRHPSCDKTRRNESEKDKSTFITGQIHPHYGPRTEGLRELVPNNGQSFSHYPGRALRPGFPGTEDLSSLSQKVLHLRSAPE